MLALPLLLEVLHLLLVEPLLLLRLPLPRRRNPKRKKMMTWDSDSLIKLSACYKDEKLVISG